MSKAAALTTQLEALTTDQPMTPAREGQTARPTLPLKHHQIEAYTEELRRLGDLAAGRPRDLDGQPWKESMGGDTALAKKRVREIRKILADQAPKKITGDRANQVFAVCKSMVETVFKPNMLSGVAARRSPAGAVGHIQRTEFTAAWNRAAVAYKRAVRALDPENPDPDLTNLERFRPTGDSAGQTATYMADAVIPGNFAFGSLAKDNWPFDAPTADTALTQVKRREAAEAVTAHPPTTGHARVKTSVREKRPASAAQLAAVARMTAARVAKRAAAQAEAQGD